MDAVVGFVIGGIACLVITAVLEGLGAELLLALRQRLARIASREPHTSEQVTCSLRSASGAYGLTPSWVSGVASLAPSEIRFTVDGIERVLAITSLGTVPADTSRGLIRSARLTVHTVEGAIEISVDRRLADRLRTIVVAPH